MNHKRMSTDKLCTSSSVFGISINKAINIYSLTYFPLNIFFGSHTTMSEEDVDDLDDFLDDFQDKVLSEPPKPNQFDEMLKELSAVDPSAANDLNELLRNDKPEFQNAINDAVSRLKTSGEKVDQKAHENAGGLPEKLIEQLLEQLNLDPSEDNINLEDILSKSGEGGEFDMSNLLNEMLSKLSSKAIIYEPLKELHDNFPPWLEKNKGSIKPEDLEKYKEQQKLIGRIVERFEDSTYDDQDEAHKEFISKELETLQDLGMPPSELMNNDLAQIPGFSQEEDGGEDLNLEEACTQQ